MSNIYSNFSGTDVTCTFTPYEPDTFMQMRLVNAVTTIMKKYFCIPSLESFEIIFDIKHDTPETFKQIRKIYIPALDVYWCQIIFQYAHEFCHLLIPEPISNHFRWFEEAICDLSSLFFLQVMAEKWISIFPEHANFQNSIIKYISNLTTGIPFPLESLSDTNSDIYSYLSNECYNRDLNRFFALQMLPIFSNHPILWTAVPQLCDGADSSSFLEYLQCWKHNTNQHYIDEIISKIYH